MKRWVLASIGLAGVLSGVGCATISDIGATVGEVTGTISPEQADSVRRVGQALEVSWQDITPEQEYYIGRAVSASILANYQPWNEPAANDYLNLLGQSLALVSDKPETFGGYRFLILDSDEINAFAAPGGFIFVTRGMLRLCRTEEELAAVLAHEIGHVQHQHGLRAIRSARWTSTGMTLLLEAGRSFSGAEIAQLTEALGGTVTDITQTMMQNGYSRSLEREADAAAVTILRRLGYDPQALVRMLNEMENQLQPDGKDFARTHPKPADRIRDIRRTRGWEEAERSTPSERQRRFEAAMSGI
jgi:predicted Zn-dependent protease